MQPTLTFLPGSTTDSYYCDSNFGLLLFIDIQQALHNYTRLRLRLLSHCCGVRYLPEGHEVSCTKCWSSFKVDDYFQDEFMVLELPRVWEPLQPTLTLLPGQKNEVLETLSLRLALFVENARKLKVDKHLLAQKFSGPLLRP